MQQEDQTDLELKRELNRRFSEEEPEQFARAQKKRRVYIRLSALIVAAIFIMVMAGNWLRTLDYPSLAFLQESWELNRDPAVRILREAVVRVEATRSGSLDSEPRELRGTGFNIDPGGVIVTNRHLVEDADRITVTFMRYGRFRAVEWHWSEEADLAIIYLESEGLPLVEPDLEYIPVPGEAVMIIGNPLSFTGITLRGTIEAVGTHTGSGTLVAQVGAPVHPGHSGSPVFNDNRMVVGVIYASLGNLDTENPAGLAVLMPALKVILEKTKH